MATSSETFTGYIEGYFGRELNWSQRKSIIDHLSSLGMNSYLYAPKEDPYHRVHWKTEYPIEWQKNLQELVSYGKAHGVEVTPALAPGLSYDYLSSEDYRLLLKKFELYFSLGINHVALLMDDISENLPENCFGAFNSLGQAHGSLLVKLQKDLREKNRECRLWFCPTIYTDQFVKGKAVDSVYIQDLKATMPENITLMWTGPQVISEKLGEEGCGELVDMFNGNVLFWDNIWANDYAPYRLFVGAFEGREQSLIKRTRGVMINPTGLPETDKFLLSLFNNFLTDGDVSAERWQKTAGEFGVPEMFMNISKFFWLPFTEVDSELYSDEAIESYGDLYNDLIVDWVHPLKMEWFTWLHGLYLDFVYLQRDKAKLQPWVQYRYPPVLADVIKKR